MQTFYSQISVVYFSIWTIMLVNVKLDLSVFQGDYISKIAD